jgi:ATP-dependent DNA helicase RecG
MTQAALSEANLPAARTIERNIEKLRDQNRIKRVGPDKGGHWEVVS